MAFDMSAGEQHEFIDHGDEFLFPLAAAHPDRYPELLGIWDRFYDDPWLSAAQSGALVNELAELLATNGGLANKPLAAVVARLQAFFGMARRTGQHVKCFSD